MNTHADKKQENKSQAVANSLQKQQSNNETAFQFIDNRPEAIAQRTLQEMTNNSPVVKQLSAIQQIANNSLHVKQLKDVQTIADNNTFKAAQLKKNNAGRSLQGKFEPIQKKENKTGLPDHLKSGVENLSGYSMDNVKVHYNSSQPAQLNALAYAQGNDIHIAPGQEKHLPHEAWHVVQQAQGRVKPTMQLKEGIPVNDDKGLEHEADVMGAMALSIPAQLKEPEGNEMIQAKFETIQRQGPEEEEMLQGKFETLQRQGPDEEEMLQGKFNPGPFPFQFSQVIQKKNPRLS